MGLSWMAWTWETAAFFICIAAMLVGMDDSPSHKPWLTSGRPMPVPATPQRGER